MVTKLSAGELEWALVAEAMRRYDRFQTYGLPVEAFEVPKHRRVLEALAEVHEAGEKGLDAVSRVLQRQGHLDTIGGVRGLSELAGGPGFGIVPDPQRLGELYRLRKLRDSSLESARLAGEGDFTAALAATQTAYQEALDSVGGKTLDSSELGVAVLASVASQLRTKKVYPGLPRIANVVGDLSVGTMTIVAGDTNCGKSSVAVEMLAGLAESGGIGGLVSVEDPAEVTGARLLANFCNVSARNITRGNKLTAEDIRQIHDGAKALGAQFGSRLLFEDCMGGNDVDVCAAMSRMAARGAKLVVVDYIQEIECSKKQQDRRNEIRWLGKRLKFHARRLGVALVVVSQLSRPNDKQMGKRPNKHMIKESGDLVNQAEVLLMLWREEESDSAPITVTVAKCKHGGVGSEWKMQRRADLGGRLVEVKGWGDGED